MRVLETDRLMLRRMSEEDAPFMLTLLNDPDFLKYIGDRGVRDLEQARAYIAKGPLAMYARYGFGLFMAELKATGVPIGICGLIKRDGLDDVDIGFAFLPAFRCQGYAFEAASAALAYAKDAIKLERIVAITSLNNEVSARLLEKLGLRFERVIDFGEEKLKLFSC